MCTHAAAATTKMHMNCELDYIKLYLHTAQDGCSAVSGPGLSGDLL